MVALSWKHHTLIQALMSRGPLKEKEFHSVFTGVTGKNPVGASKKMFDEYLLAINKELSYVHFELRACRDQYDGQICYGVVNNVSDEQSKFGTKYSVPQIAFYKGIIEAITQDATAQGSLSSFEALNIRLENQISILGEPEPQSSQAEVPAAIRNFTLSQKEKTLNELVHDKWLCHTPEGNIGLGTRSFLDLRSWFRNNDVPSCEVCNEAAVKAMLCPNVSCTVRIHKYCLRNMLNQRKDRVCPGCGKQWQFDIPKDELGAEEEDVTNAPSQSQGSAAAEPRRKRLRSGTNIDAAAPEISTQASTPSSADGVTKRVTRSSSRFR